MNDRGMGEMDARQGSAGRTYLCDELGEFFEEFTETFEGRKVAVEERGRDGRQRMIADGQPLAALSYQVDNDSFNVRIVLGSDAGETFAHIVPDVRQIDYESRAGAAEELRLQSSNALTDVRFR